MANDANDLIMGGGVTAAKFEAINDFVQGTIVKIGEKTQCRKYKKTGIGDLDFWDDGTPKWQVRIDVQTTVRDPLIPHDDGIRGIYVPAGKQIRNAIQLAVKEVGEREIKVGAHLGVQLIDLEENDTNNPTKIHKAVYGAPPSTASGLIMDTPAQQAPPPVQQMQQPIQQPPVMQPVQSQAAMQAAPVHMSTVESPTPEQLAQFAAWQASQQPAQTMQHPLGQAGMQQPAQSPADDPKVQELLRNVSGQ